MPTWIVVMWLVTMDYHSNSWVHGVATPILWDYASQSECEEAALDIIARPNDEAFRKQLKNDFAKYGYAGVEHRNVRCIRGPQKLPVTPACSVGATCYWCGPDGKSWCEKH